VFQATFFVTNRFRLFVASSCSTTTDSVDRDCAATEEDQSERDSGEAEWEFHSSRAKQPMFPVNFRDRDAHVDEDGERRAACEQPSDQKNAADEFNERRDISEPGWHPEAVNVASVFLHVAVHLVRAVRHEDQAQRHTQYKQSERLHAIEITQRKFSVLRLLEGSSRME
jgi:hypothetical protein